MATAMVVGGLFTDGFSPQWLIDLTKAVYKKQRKMELIATNLVYRLLVFDLVVYSTQGQQVLAVN